MLFDISGDDDAVVIHTLGRDCHCPADRLGSRAPHAACHEPRRRAADDNATEPRSSLASRPLAMSSGSSGSDDRRWQFAIAEQKGKEGKGKDGKGKELQGKHGKGKDEPSPDRSPSRKTRRLDLENLFQQPALHAALEEVARRTQPNEQQDSQQDETQPW